MIEKNSMKLAWLTDIHLNFLDAKERKKFYGTVINTNSDSVLISGDIAEAPSLISILNEMVEQIKKPIFFIVGNHDYYRGNVDDVQSELKILSKSNKNLFWLPATGLQHLEKNIILIGQDGWADGRLGDYENSRVRLNDCRMITDLFQANLLGRKQLLQKMQELADHDSHAMRNNLAEAINQKPEKIIVLTHIPPFKEVCQHMGQISDDNYLPYFSSKVMGELLLSFAQENPSIEFLVLCGHTHSKALYQPCGNLIVKAGAAEYYQPAIQEIIYI